MKKIFLLLVSLVVAQGQTTTTTVPVRDKTYYPEAYGAKVNDGVDDKTALQACIDAAESAGGGIVQLRAGIYEVRPLATGIGLTINGDKVQLRGVGPTTIIRGITVGTGDATVTSNPFVLIGGKGYQSTVTPYGASGIWIEDLKLECDSNDATATASTPARNGHGLISLIHTPWSIVRGVTFGDIVYHQIEVQRCRNALIEDCVFGGNTESSRVQFDEGGASGQGNSTVYRSGAAAPSGWIDGITFRKCRFAGRNLTGQDLAVVRNIELYHTGNVVARRVLFENCEIGPVYSPGTTTLGYSMALQSETVRCDGLTIRDCLFLGDATGITYGLSIIPGTSVLRDVTIENNIWSGGPDANGTWFGGGFAVCLQIGTATYGSTITGGGGGTITNYGNRQNIVVRNNLFAPKLTLGTGPAAIGPNLNLVVAGSLSDLALENNVIRGPVYSSIATVSGTTWTSTTAHDLHPGEQVRLLTTGTLPTGFATGTTYYVVDVSGSSTFRLAASAGGTAISGSGGSGTHRWQNYLGNVTMGYTVGFAISEIVNLRMINNSAVWLHDNTATTGYNGAIYSMIFTSQGLESANVSHGALISGNRNVAPSGGGGNSGLREYGSATTYGVGRVEGNNVSGTWSSGFSLAAHGRWLPPNTKGADLASAATLNLATATGDLLDVTGTTGITAITLPEGEAKTCRFTGVLTLTNGASLILPGNANITTAAGDVAIFRGYSGSVVRCINYQRQATAP